MAQRILELSVLESALCHEARLVPVAPTLVFQTAPASLEEPVASLSPSIPDNTRFLAYRAWLSSQQHTLLMLTPLGHRDADRRRSKLLEKIKDQLQVLSSMEGAAWEKQKLLCGLYGFPDESRTHTAKVYHTGMYSMLLDLCMRDDIDYCASEHLFTSRRTLQPFILVALLVTSTLHTVSGLNREAADLVLMTMRAVLTGAFIACNKVPSSTSLSPPSATQASPSSRKLVQPRKSRRRNHGRLSPLTLEQQEILNSVPRDIRTALSHLKVEPNIICYATCPRCSQTYAPDPAKPDDPYPRFCTFAETDKPVCGAALTLQVAHAANSTSGAERFSYPPLRPYPYRTVFSWIASLFSQRVAEAIADSSWIASALSPGSPIADIIQSPALRNFLGPDGSLFSKPLGSDIHLVFGLFIDWFNPGGNKKAGKSRSIGAIYLVCLNLPPELRFLPEYICLVGIIPGPNEPSLQELNHFLRPFIDEFLVLWHAGIRLSRTAMYPAGRLVRAVIIPLICDLPALRKTAGFAGHSSTHFCSFCLLKKSNINNLSRPWPSRTWKEHLDIASRWRDAKTEAERKKIFDTHGLRWSEMLRLPYWDPTCYAVVDAMHNLFLGDLRHHCREVWGINIKDQKTTAKKAVPHTPEEQEKWMGRLLGALCKGVLPNGKLKKGALAAVTQPRKGYLVALAQLNGIVPELKLTKHGYGSALLEWVSSPSLQRSRCAADRNGSCQVRQHSVDALRIPPILSKATNEFHLAENQYDISKFQILTADIMAMLRSDILATFLPSWIERPPTNFGSSAHGKLKADHWRTVCTVSMVITLVRVWSLSTATTGERKLLENFVHLVIAVDLATRRSMDAERARLFDHHMLEYLRTLCELFDHDLVPNHHLSLHLASCLLLFGPVRGMWGFPFERYNGIRKNLPS